MLKVSFTPPFVTSKNLEYLVPHFVEHRIWLLVHATHRYPDSLHPNRFQVLVAFAVLDVVVHAAVNLHGYPHQAGVEVHNISCDHRLSAEVNAGQIPA